MSFLGDILQSALFFDPSRPLIFTQFYFWAFFAIVFALFSCLHSKIMLRNAFLFFASLFFYYKTSGSYLLLLIFCVSVNFLGGRFLEKLRKTAPRTIFLVLLVAIDLFTLGYFKYAYFFLDVLHQLFGVDLKVYNFFAAASNRFLHTGSLVDQIILPVGISFFTFQAISYVVDVYKKSIRPIANFFDFGFYLTFFPALVAGPIIRADKFIPQLHRPYFLSRRAFALAIFWILNGLAKKIVMSDFLATQFVDRVFETPLLFTGFENLLALFAYSLQVYADFSGYTDIATGVALLMGFRLPQNFHSPYKADRPSEFWHRWHISLSRWLRDYLYIPLGGNRRASFGTFFWTLVISAIAVILSGSFLVACSLGILLLSLLLWGIFRPDSRRTIAKHTNAMITQLMGGLWHGASWNFIVWGGLNGVGMILNTQWSKQKIEVRAILMFLLTATFALLCKFRYEPLWGIACVWCGIIFLGIYASMIYGLFSKTPLPRLKFVWNVLLTFVFITSTRLFFRSGSNLDPAEANEVAWETARNMIHQIGTPWNLSLVPQMAFQHLSIILVFCLGMTIHWLPENFKRTYRILFAKLPKWAIALLTVLACLVIYQFSSADSPPFIYFQF